MTAKTFIRAIIVGLVATFAMSLLGFFFHQFGVPRLDWGVLFSYLGVGMWLGYALLFVSGSLLAILYVFFFHERLPATSWKRGLFFALILWLITGMILTPYLGFGFFMGNLSVAFGTLLNYMIYGTVLGYLYDA